MVTEKRISVQSAFVVTVVAGAMFACAAAAFLWAEDERSRVLRDWQSRLLTLAASRADAVSDWVADQNAVIANLQQNEALQLYAFAVDESFESGTPDTALVERQYLETLLQVTARQHGFSREPLGRDVPANVPRVNIAGIAIVNRNLRILAASEVPPLEANVTGALVSRQFNDPGNHMSELYREGPRGAVSMALTGPVMSVQAETPFAALVAVKPVADELFPLLRQPGEVFETAEALLLERREGVVRYLSPSRDGTAALSRELPGSQQDKAGVFAATTPREFAILADYAGQEVLVSSWPVNGTSWVVAYKVGLDEVLGPLEARLLRTQLLLLAGILISGVGALGLWRHGASVRAHNAMLRFRETSEALQKQVAFTQMLSDAEPNVTFVVDASGRLTFANRRCVEVLGAGSSEGVIGKDLTSAFGTALGRAYDRHVSDARAAAARLVILENLELGGEPRRVRSYYVPLNTDAKGAESDVLVVHEDVTEMLAVEERQRAVQVDVVSHLVSLIDGRDPMTARHSERVAKVSEKIAELRGENASWTEALKQAALLFNVGRIFVDREVFLDNRTLTERELENVRAAMQHGVEFVSGIGFERPVGEIIRAAFKLREDQLENTGGAEGDEDAAAVMRCARVLASVDVLLALTSARSYREALTVEAALDVLRTQEGKYGAETLAALDHYVHNAGGREMIEAG